MCCHEEPSNRHRPPPLPLAFELAHVIPCLSLANPVTVEVDTSKFVTLPFFKKLKPPKR